MDHSSWAIIAGHDHTLFSISSTIAAYVLQKYILLYNNLDAVQMKTPCQYKLAYIFISFLPTALIAPV
jgi:hypothetical protein